MVRVFLIILKFRSRENQEEPGCNLFLLEAFLISFSFSFSMKFALNPRQRVNIPTDEWAISYLNLVSTSNIFLGR